MINNSHKQKMKAIFIGLFALIMLQGCSYTNRITEVNDMVYSSKRIEWRTIYRDYNRKSPLLFVEQSVIKEIKNDKSLSYQVFDILNLSGSSFRVEDKVFVIVDNEVFPMLIENKEYDNVTNIDDMEDIVTDDSSGISVVADFSELSSTNRKIARFSYELTGEIIDKIYNSEQVAFQYYSGPDLLTVKLKNHKLKKFKCIIDRI